MILPIAPTERSQRTVPGERVASPFPLDSAVREPVTAPGRLRDMNHLPSARRLGVGVFVLSLVLAACSAGAGPSASPSPVAPSADPSVSAPPSADAPGSPAPSAGNVGDEGKLVVPKPGQLDVRVVKADELVARVEGSNVIVTVSWTSGVEPCNVLDQVIVTKGDGTYAITLREGHGPEDVVCIAIAETHKTEVVIENVAPGTYQITDATGGAAPIEVTVS